MCNHYLKSKRRNCLFAAKHNGFCTRHSNNVDNVFPNVKIIKSNLRGANKIDEKFLKIVEDESNIYNDSTNIGKNLICELVYNMIGSDLIISLFYTSLQSKHRILPNGMSKEECEQILNQCPNTEVLKNIASEGVDHMRFILDMINPKLYTLLTFILCETMIRIVYIDKQFKLITKDTEYGNNFEKSKETHTDVKIVKLFHGSALQNWYSILKNGLKDYSGTKNQLHGAAYGNGVYLSSSNSMSHLYSKHTQNPKLTSRPWSNSKTITSHKSCVLIECEVIQSENWKRTRCVYVVSDEKLINPCTLYIV